nr:MAG TPA: hypothetical protein [Caudoviricetes sp.]
MTFATVFLNEQLNCLYLSQIKDNLFIMISSIISSANYFAVLIKINIFCSPIYRYLEH